MIPNVSIPEGKSGDWEVQHLVISERDASFHALRCAMNPQRHEIPLQPGTVTRLVYKGSVVMSDTPQEKHDHSPFVRKAHGRVLIAGMGLGMVANAVARKDNVSDVTVVEISLDVVSLVAGSLDSKIGLVNADVRTWKPDRQQWDCMWIDIWNEVSTDHLPEMTRLKRRYRRWVTGEIGCWGQDRARASRARVRNKTGWY